MQNGDEALPNNSTAAPAFSTIAPRTRIPNLHVSSPQFMHITVSWFYATFLQLNWIQKQFITYLLSSIY